MTTPRAALLLSFLERYSTLAVYALSNVILSRLLTPHDTGLFTIGFALTVMIGTFRDFGVSTYIIQEPELDDLKWRSALGVSAVTCAVVFLAVLALSFAAGRAYHDPAVTGVMLVTSLTLLLIPFNALILAWLRRELRYGALYRISLAAASTQTLVTVGLAWAGFGAMSMAWGSVANSAVILLGSIRVRPRNFGYAPTLAGWRPIAGLGVYSTVGTVCNEITPNGADLFLGRFGGLIAVGEFSKGASLVSFVNQGLVNAILPVALSIFAQKRRAGEALDEALPHSLTLLTGVTWPAFAGLAVVAYPTIHLLFGRQWDAAIAPSRLVAVAAMITSMVALHGIVFQAAGAMRARMYVQLAVTPAQLAALFVAAHGSLTDMALGTVASAVIEYLPSQLVVNRICRTTMLGVLAALLPSAVVTCCTALGALAAVALLPASPNAFLLPLVAALATGAIGWVAGLYVARHPLGAEMATLLRSISAQLRRWRSVARV